MATWGVGSAHRVKLGALYTQAGISAPTVPLIKTDLFGTLLTPQGSMMWRQAAAAQLPSLILLKPYYKGYGFAWERTGPEKISFYFDWDKLEHLKSPSWLLTLALTLKWKLWRCVLLFCWLEIISYVQSAPRSTMKISCICTECFADTKK